MNVFSRLAAALFALTLSAFPAAAMAAPFTLTATGVPDNAMLFKDGGFDKNGGDGTPCGGTNKAPGWTWTGVPDKTQSFAILELDPDGAGGMGVSHYVIYNIPGSAPGLSSDDVAAAKFTTGRGQGDLTRYRGPCPPKGDAPHHYIVTVYALDLPPTLAEGLDRAGLLAAMKGHVTGATSTIMRYAR